MTFDDRALEELLRRLRAARLRPRRGRPPSRTLLRRRARPGRRSRAPGHGGRVARRARSERAAPTAPRLPSWRRRSAIRSTSPRRLYDAEAQRLGGELEGLDAADYDVETANGLSAWSLVVHLAAQESLLAQAVGHPVDDVEVDDVEERTTVLVERFRGRSVDDVLALWREAVAAVDSWARGRPPAESHVAVDRPADVTGRRAHRSVLRELGAPRRSPSCPRRLERPAARG